MLWGVLCTVAAVLAKVVWGGASLKVPQGSQFFRSLLGQASLGAGKSCFKHHRRYWSDYS